MALNHVIRKVSALKVVPLAIRAAAGGCRTYHLHSSVIFSSAVKRSLDPSGSGKFFNCSLPSAIQHYSSRRSVDEPLIKVIEDEIQCAKETEGVDKVEEVPEGFPFKIEDHPGQNSVTLSREYEGEKITVEVGIPSLVSGEEEEDAGDDDDGESNSSSAIPLIVRVSRNKGRDLEFGCTAYPDEISIDSLSLKDPDNSEDQLAYEGPDFEDLDENLQKAFHKYLEIRGVNPSTTNFLHEFMINKDSREYLLWLNNIKHFIES